jgi:hypothetical protein
MEFLAKAVDTIYVHSKKVVFVSRHTPVFGQSRSGKSEMIKQLFKTTLNNN